MNTATRPEHNVVAFPSWSGHKQFEIGGRQYVVAEIGSFKEPPLVQLNLRLRKRDVARWQFLLFGAVCSSLTAFAIKLLQL